MEGCERAPAGHGWRARARRRARADGTGMGELDGRSRRSTDAPRLGSDRSGSTAIEYALLAAVVAITTIGAMLLMGGETGGMWAVTGDAIVDGLTRNAPP